MKQALQSIADRTSGPAELRGLQFSARGARGQARTGGPGDFFDAFRLPSGRWGIVVGDARPAAVQTAGAESAEAGIALVRAVMYATAQVEPRPSPVLAAANRALAAAPAEQRLRIAVTYATVRPGRTGTWVRIGAAGGQTAYVRRRSGDVVALGRPGAPLGTGPDVQPFLARLLLRPGDSLILITGRVPGALGTAAAIGIGDNGLLATGVDQFRAIVGTLSGASAARCTDTILRAVRGALGGRPSEEIVAVTVKVPGQRRGSGVHSGGWPGTRRYSHATSGAGQRHGG